MTQPQPTSSQLILLKLGGSLITDKSQPHTVRADILARLAGEVAHALTLQPALRIILGHGSGSFGHVPANKYGTRQGVSTAQEWRGFLEVWREAAALDHLVMSALIQAGLPAIAFPPSASVTAARGQVSAWNLTPLQNALEAGLLPVIYGDVVFDTVLGGTILSTEDLFEHLAKSLQPERLLLAGLEPGVWADFPACQHLLPEITPGSSHQVEGALQGSASTDVTGGMASKVQQSLVLLESMPGLEILIFSGEQPGAVTQALTGAQIGTLIHART